MPPPGRGGWRLKLGLVVMGGLSRDPADGTIPALQWLVERLTRRHEVHVFTLYGAARPDRYPMLGATVHHVAGQPLRAWRLIIAEHGRGAFDLLHNFWLVPGGAITVIAGRLLRIPVLVHAAGGELVSLPGIGYGSARYWRGRLWARLALAGAARISAASKSMIDTIAARGYRAERVPLGVDLGKWPPRAPRRRPAGQTARLVHVGSLNAVKDQTTLLQAAREMQRQGRDFQLDIAGADTLRGRMQGLARDWGLGARVHFHGFLSQERLRPLVEGADLLWITSRHEAGPVAVLEAAVAGVPTVGTAVGHIAEWAPAASVAVAVGDPVALARETTALLDDEPRRLALASEAQRLAVAQDADWTAQRFEDLYHEVLRDG